MKNKKFDITINILFYISIVIIVASILFICIDIKLNQETIEEYFIYKKTGVDIDKLYKFTMNATESDKKNYFTYLNNLSTYNPALISENQLTQIQYLLKVRFIPIYNWTLLIIFSVLMFISFVYTIYYLIYKWPKNKMIVI